MDKAAARAGGSRRRPARAADKADKPDKPDKPDNRDRARQPTPRPSRPRQDRPPSPCRPTSPSRPEPDADEADKADKPDKKPKARRRRPTTRRPRRGARPTRATRATTTTDGTPTEIATADTGRVRPQGLERRFVGARGGVLSGGPHNGSCGLSGTPYKNRPNPPILAGRAFAGGGRMNRTKLCSASGPRPRSWSAAAPTGPRRRRPGPARVRGRPARGLRREGQEHPGRTAADRRGGRGGEAIRSRWPLIDGWMALPEYQQKMMVFFELAFQQTQISAVDFVDIVPPNGLVNGAGIPHADPEREPELRAHGARAAGPGPAADRRVHDQQLMMTPALMALYAFLDTRAVDDDGRSTTRSRSANPGLEYHARDLGRVRSRSTDASTRRARTTCTGTRRT